MPAAIKYCTQHKLNFTLLPFQKFTDFVKTLSTVKNLVFFPQWMESYSRLAIEARILGCKLVTNTLLGVSSEPYFELKGRPLLEFIKQNNQNIYDRYISFIEGEPIPYEKPIALPKVSLIVPLYNGEEYITGFLEDIKNQTLFENSEVIIINANSPQDEEKYILEFIAQHPNVIYKKLDYRATVMETENMAIQMASGEYIAQACVDDRRSVDYLEALAKTLYFNPEVDLVYGDCYQTPIANETYIHNSSKGNLYEHSLQSFSRENMIKCLPGPMPMWRKSMHQKCGYFDEELAHAGDWDFFLRAVDNGCLFKKVMKPLGLYYYNSEGLSTSEEYFKTRTKEECKIFKKYRKIFGEKCYNKYLNYFNQFE